MVKKAKAKEWLKVLAPPVFGSIEIAETPCDDPQKVIGRRLIVSAIDVLNDYNKYYLKISFKIKEVKEGKAITEFDGFECTRDYIARMVVRRVRRIDSIVDGVTKDNRKLRVKMIAVTRRGIKKVAEKEMRRKMKEIILETLSSSSFDDAVKKLVSDDFKEEIKKQLHKIYPVRYFEFRKVEVLG